VSVAKHERQRDQREKVKPGDLSSCRRTKRRSVVIETATIYVSFEGKKKWPTDGKKYKQPIQEAPQAEPRLKDNAQSAFDEFQILRFRATNAKPFPFEWVDLSRTEMEYSSILTRVSREYDRRFA
jgi:hypothetical protein